eukprot:240646-Hanusia_phi.AAC.1
MATLPPSMAGSTSRPTQSTGPSRRRSLLLTPSCPRPHAPASPPSSTRPSSRSPPPSLVQEQSWAPGCPPSPRTPSATTRLPPAPRLLSPSPLLLLNLPVGGRHVGAVRDSSGDGKDRLSRLRLSGKLGGTGACS